MKHSIFIFTLLLFQSIMPMELPKNECYELLDDYQRDIKKLRHNPDVQEFLQKTILHLKLAADAHESQKKGYIIAVKELREDTKKSVESLFIRDAEAGKFSSSTFLFALGTRQSFIYQYQNHKLSKRFNFKSSEFPLITLFKSNGLRITAKETQNYAEEFAKNNTHFEINESEKVKKLITAYLLLVTYFASLDTIQGDKFKEWITSIDNNIKSLESQQSLKNTSCCSLQ